VNFVLDTNAMSETEKPRPNAGLIAWHDAQDPAHLFVTTVTLAEVWPSAGVKAEMGVFQTIHPAICGSRHLPSPTE